MNERLFKLRKELLNKSRAKFGEPVGMTDSEIKNIETGATQLKDKHLHLICTYYNVSETWLRTGEGDPFLPRARADEIADIVNASLDRTPEEARQSLIDRLASLSDGEICVLSEILNRMFPE